MRASLRRFHLTGWVLVASCSAVMAQKARYVTENGVTYQETRQTVRQPVVQVEVQNRQKTVYEERFTTTIQETHVPVYTPVTQYTWQPRVKNWWNPFGPTQIEHRLTPTLAWRAAIHTIRTPVTQRTVVPVTRTVRTPVRKLGFVKQEQVRRVAVSRKPVGSPRGVIPQQAPIVARREVYGGIRRLDRNTPAAAGIYTHGGVQRY